MGLAGTKVKQRFGLDPRNTNWSNNTERFGHQYLEKMGWQQGKGLGLVEHATTSHIKVSLKDDNVGLGAKLAKKLKKDEFDSGECAGLDVFQRILGRLNGNEDKIGKELERQKAEEWSGKWGMTFVKGEVLQSTWDAEAASKQRLGLKRPNSDDSDVKERRRKKSKTEKGSSKTKSHKAEALKEGPLKETRKDQEDEGTKSKSLSKSRLERADKKVEKDVAEKIKREKGDRMERNTKKDKKDKKDINRASMLQPNEAPAQAIATRLSVRSRWIKQKRQSTMDAKALNEIFMITH